jgi:hypothetical protein
MTPGYDYVPYSPPITTASGQQDLGFRTPHGPRLGAVREDARVDHIDIDVTPGLISGMSRASHFLDHAEGEGRRGAIRENQGSVDRDLGNLAILQHQH